MIWIRFYDDDEPALPEWYELLREDQDRWYTKDGNFVKIAWESFVEFCKL
jgi:hypothetical protein